MVAPTVSEVQSWSSVSALLDADPAKAALYVAVANRLFERITGLTWDTVLDADAPIVQQAVRGMAELAAIEGTEDAAENLADWHLIQSFSAGSYSETRRSPEDMMKARMVHPWPWVNSLLWLLMTPERAAEWIFLFGGPPAPASSVTEIDWTGDWNFPLLGGEYPPGY